MILDTSFLIDLFAGRRTAFEKGVALSEGDAPQRVPSPVVAELAYGASVGDDDEWRNVENALLLYPTIEQAETLARRAGELLADADRDANGRSGIDKVDSMIAAVADLYDESVVTDNVSDFEKLGVAVETY